MSTLGVMGYVRGFLQVTYSLTLLEDFRESFSSAFSLTFVISGTTGLFVGLLASKYGSNKCACTDGSNPSFKMKIIKNTNYKMVEQV